LYTSIQPSGILLKTEADDPTDKI